MAAAKLDLTLLLFFHGMAVSQSRYERTTDASADIGDICLNLLNSLFAFFKSSYDIPALAIFSSN